MQRFLAILGRQPELSAAELVAVAAQSSATLQPAGDHAVLVTAPSAFAQTFRRLGGTVKFGEVIAEAPSLATLANDGFLRDLFRRFPEKGKTVFGVSTYGSASVVHDGQALAKRIKTFLTENGRSARFIVGERGVLSSVVVTKERMLERGVELLIVQHGDRIIAAATNGVQEFEEFSRRDYGRPSRNARTGMLPPKLARMMINLVGADERTTVLDPFCGSGTVLQEALLLGCHRVIGTDRDDGAVQESRGNISWLLREHTLEKQRVRIERCDVADLGKLLRPASVDAVVTEPVLGPPLRGAEDLAAIRTELTAIYEKAFRVFARLLHPGGRVVFLLPVFFADAAPRFFPDLKRFFGEAFRPIPPLPPDLRAMFLPRLSFRETIVYRRPGQRLGRELIIAERRSE